MKLFDDISGFLSKNSDWIGPVISTGLGLAQASNQQNTGKDIANLYQQMAEQEFQQKQAEDSAYADYLNRSNAYAASRSAASASAARANDAAKRKQAGKARKVYEKGNQKAQAQFAPYVQAGAQSVPIMADTYKNSMGAYNSVLGQLMSPQVSQGLFTTPKSIWEMSTPLKK